MTSAQKPTCNLSSHSFPQNPKETCPLLALFWIVISERRKQTASEIRVQGEPGKKKKKQKKKQKKDRDSKRGTQIWQKKTYYNSRKHKPQKEIQ
jgi:hypothetical protein